MLLNAPAATGPVHFFANGYWIPRSLSPIFIYEADFGNWTDNWTAASRANVLPASDGPCIPISLSSPPQSTEGI